MAIRFGGVGVALPLNQIGTNGFVLEAGSVFSIPSGTYSLRHGPYCSVQLLDPVAQIWRPIGSDGGNYIQVDSDGTNYRVANQTGCAVAALLTNAGAGYTSAPTVTASAGGSVWTAIMGNVISTTITVVTGGSNYTYPPIISIQAPPAPGIPATAYCTLSAGAVSTVTVTNQGAGYITAPQISVINDPRDTTGAGAVCTASLTGAQTVTAVICTNHGSAITSGTTPTLSFSGGGGSNAAAVVLMDWTITSYAVTAGGAGYNGNVRVLTQGYGQPTFASAYTNPDSQLNLVRTADANITGAITSNAIVAAGQVLQFGGHFMGNTTNLNALIIGGLSTTVATLTFGVGGQNDYLYIQNN